VRLVGTFERAASRRFLTQRNDAAAGRTLSSEATLFSSAFAASAPAKRTGRNAEQLESIYAGPKKKLSPGFRSESRTTPLTTTSRAKKQYPDTHFSPSHVVSRF